MINDVACFTFHALVLPVAVEAPRDISSCGCTSLPTKEVSSPRSEISYSAGSRASDATSISEISLSSTTSCVSLDAMERSSAGSILKPVGGDFFLACRLLPIWRDLLAMFTISSYTLCLCVSFLKICLIKKCILFFNAACGS